MEAKIEELGLDSILDYSLSKPTKPSFIKNKVDIFTEMVKIRTEIKNWNSSKKTTGFHGVLPRRIQCNF